MKLNEKRAKAEPETTNVAIRLRQKQKGQKTSVNLVLKWDKYFRFFGKISKIIVIDCCIIIYSSNSKFSFFNIYPESVLIIECCDALYFEFFIYSFSIRWIFW